MSLDLTGASLAHEDQWLRVRDRLRAEISDVEYRSWLLPLTFRGLAVDRAVLAVPQRYHRDWIKSHYLERLRCLWASENRAIQRVDIMVMENDGRPAPVAATPDLFVDPNDEDAMVSDKPIATAVAPARKPARAGERDPGSVLDRRFTFDNFVVGKPNEFAFAVSRRVAEAAVGGEPTPFNPLYLHSAVGLGKTHLMHAIAWQIHLKNPEKRVVYLSAETFMQRFVQALRQHDTSTFKELFRSVDVLMVDDIQFVAGKDQTQEEFFHTFNALVDNNRQVILSADKAPKDLDGITERLKSRLGWGLVADIFPTTYELRLGILQSKAEHAKVEIPLKLLEFLAQKITTNVRELEGALTRIVAFADLMKRPVTLDSVHEVLPDLLRSGDKRIGIDEIQKQVAIFFKIKLSDMLSQRRDRVVTRPRQIAMYLCKQLTPRSLPEIGRKFDDRDHTTVLHAVRKVEQLMRDDASIAEDVALVRRVLEG